MLAKFSRSTGLGSDEVVVDVNNTGGSKVEARASSSASSDGVEFAFNDISFTVPAKNAKGEKIDKHILTSVSGSVLSGQVLAILGPSGAGKTTLLNCLTLEAFGGRVEGSVTLGEHALTPETFSKHCTVVNQVDRHWAFLTARETVTFAADFYLNGTAAEKKAKVEEMLTKMGLLSCAETKVGNQFMQGLSGGQKRRLSLAVALIKSPKLVFLDEPTSGLDAAAASGIMKFVKDVARNENIIIVCTIHQPSSLIFHNFDETMILSSGRTAYIGTARNAVPYFASQGHKIPGDTNPADFLLDLVNREFTDPEQVETLLNGWEEKTNLERRNNSSSSSSSNKKASSKRPTLSSLEKGVGKKARNGFVFDTKVLLRRHGLLVARDPMVYLGRAIMFMLATSFFAIIYIKSGDRVQEQVLFRLFYCMWLFGVPTSLGVIAVYAYNEEFFAIKKEVKNGMFSTSSYLAANFILQIPLLLVLSVSAVTVGSYFILGWHSPNYLPMIIIYAIALFGFESLAQLFSVMFANPLLGMLQFMNSWFMAFLFAGIMVPVADVIWPFRLFCYVLPLYYGLRSMIYMEIIDTEFEGAELCSDLLDTDCSFHLDDSGAQILPGWKCTGEFADFICLGRTGEQVLDSLGVDYQSVSSENRVVMDTLINLGIAVFFKVSYMVVMNYNVTSASKIYPVKNPSSVVKKVCD